MSSFNQILISLINIITGLNQLLNINSAKLNTDMGGGIISWLRAIIRDWQRAIIRDNTVDT